MPRLSREERLIALGMIQTNNNYSEVARHFGYTRRIIRNLVERNAETGSIDDRLRPGKERVTTSEQDRYINLIIFETTLGRPVLLFVRNPEGINHGSAV